MNALALAGAVAIGLSLERALRRIFAVLVLLSAAFVLAKSLV